MGAVGRPRAAQCRAVRAATASACRGARVGPDASTVASDPVAQIRGGLAAETGIFRQTANAAVWEKWDACHKNMGLMRELADC